MPKIKTSLPKRYLVISVDSLWITSADTGKQVHVVEERNKELIRECKCKHLREEMCKHEKEKAEREVKVVLQKKVGEDQKTNQLIQAFLRTLKTENANVHSLKEQRKELKGETKSFPVTPIQLPDCPVPASLPEELLNTQPTVSKEKLQQPAHLSPPTRTLK
ncbi:uncharacterized protein [Notamacropus eugenii]|uniref:uncharacterized protein isoform X3 n=1 Tax=Notamacropus eugenii TaxID=9315 RepID=UPI003B675F43